MQDTLCNKFQGLYKSKLDAGYFIQKNSGLRNIKLYAGYFIQ